MSHHFDTTLAKSDPRLNICDLYVFKGSNDSTVLIQTCCADAGISSPDTFHPEGTYAFRIDLNSDAREELAFKFRFGEPCHLAGEEHGHAQSFRVLRAFADDIPGDKGQLLAEGSIGTSVRGAQIKAFAGMVPEMWAADAFAFFSMLTNLFQEDRFDPKIFEHKQNLFQNRNVMAIVLEVPNSLIGTGQIHVWATVSLFGHAPETQVARWGLPLITHLFLANPSTPDLPDKFHSVTPSRDAELFGPAIEADTTRVAAKVSGYVRSMPVEDYERVRAGQLLVQLVDDDYKATVDQLAASVQSAAATIEAFKAQRTLQAANVQATKATIAATMANVEQNDRDLARQRQLRETGSSSTEATEKLQTMKAQLAAQLEQNRAQEQAASRQLDVLGAQQTQAEAALLAQKANLEFARINLGYTSIVAPQDGVIGQRQVKPGQFVPVGGQVTSLTPLPHVWVIANYKETQLTHLLVGQTAQIRVDTFPGRILKGHVQSWAPGSGAQFSLLPPDNATGNFTKIVQRIAVKILIDDADGVLDRLRPGMSVVTTIETREDGVR
jgi:membrane fusion protein, multidrug efflux system